MKEISSVRDAAVLTWARRSSRLVERAAALALIGLAITVLLQVGSRYLFTSPLIWTVDGATILLIWVSFLGAAVAAIGREHFAVELVIRVLPSALRRVVLVLSNLTVVLVLAILAVVGSRFALLQMDQIYSTVPIAKGWAAIAIPVSAVMMIPRYLIDAWCAADLDAPKINQPWEADE